MVYIGCKIVFILELITLLGSVMGKNIAKTSKSGKKSKNDKDRWYIPVYNDTNWHERQPHPSFESDFTYRDFVAPLGGWATLFSETPISYSQAKKLAPEPAFLYRNYENLYSDDIEEDERLDNYSDVYDNTLIVPVQDNSIAAKIFTSPGVDFTKIGHHNREGLKSYFCNLPYSAATGDIYSGEYKLLTTRSDLIKVSTEVYQDRINRTLDIIMSRKDCLEVNHGWWTYQVCPKYIRQFHVSGPDTSPAERLKHSLLDFHLGVRIGSHVLLQNSDGSHFLRTRYLDGNLCEITGIPREVNIQWTCGPVEYVGDVKEQSTCIYIIEVKLPSLCGLTWFRSKSDIAVMNAKIHLTLPPENQNGKPDYVTDKFDWLSAPQSAKEVIGESFDTDKFTALTSISTNKEIAKITGELLKIGPEIICRPILDDSLSKTEQQEDHYTIPSIVGNENSQLDFLKSFYKDSDGNSKETIDLNNEDKHHSKQVGIENLPSLKEILISAVNDLNDGNENTLDDEIAIKTIVLDLPTLNREAIQNKRNELEKNNKDKEEEGEIEVPLEDALESISAMLQEILTSNNKLQNADSSLKQGNEEDEEEEEEEDSNKKNNDSDKEKNKNKN